MPCNNPLFFAITTPDGECYRFMTMEPRAIDQNLQFLDERLRAAAAAGSLTAWWLLEGRYRYRRHHA